MHIAVAVMMLGYTRTQGVVGYNTDTKSFDLITPALARKKIDNKEIYGILWRKNDSDMLEFYPDKEGWNQSDIMILSGLTYRPMINDIPGADVMNTIYSASKIIRDKEKNKYEVVSNTFQRLLLTEEQLKEIAGITVVAGVKIEDNSVKACEGLPVEHVETKAKEKTTVRTDKNTVKKKSTIRKEKAKTK